jgi:hypothetical protein
MENVYAVQQIDYEGLVASMAHAGFGENGMADVLAEQLGAIGKPQWENEIIYFWKALFNAARSNDAVWLWLMAQPHIRKFGQPGSEFHTSGQFVDNWGLPEIGGPNDQPYTEPTEKKEKFSAEPTEENFRTQAEHLDAYLRAEGEKNPGNACKTIAEYVASFYYSGTGRIHAQIQLIEGGYHALADEKGIEWLMATYPPA